MKQQLSLLLLLLCLVALFATVNAVKKISYQDQQIEIDEETSKYRISTKNGWSFWMKQDLRIHLKLARLDPLETFHYNLVDSYLQQLAQNYPHNAQLLEDLRIQKQPGLFLVQFHTQALESFKTQLREEFGAKILFPFPSQALLIELSNPELIGQISELPVVRWVGEYLPIYKIASDILEFFDASPAPKNRIPVNLMLTERGPQLQTRVSEKIIRQIGGRVISTVPEGFRVEALLTASQVVEILAQPEVLYLDISTPIGNDMNIARLAGGLLYVAEVGGYNGEGVRAEVMDSGLYLDHVDFSNLNIMIHGGNGASTSHGTSVFGIVFGEGIGNPAAKGGIPRAEASIFACYDILSTSYTRYRHTEELVAPNGTYRAVFQTNSWGNTQTRLYTSISAEMDDIIFLTDLTILQSQSNTGDRTSRPQAWAKNINSIGGVRHYNTLSRDDDRWGGGASIGPAEDGRQKPDLTNYYDLILSTNNTGDTYREFSGTSGATPITAGHYGILFQMWADGIFRGEPGQHEDPFEARPHSSTAKAIMINTANPYPFDQDSTDLIRYHQGWGTPDIVAIYDIAQIHDWRFPLMVDEADPIQPQEIISYTVVVNNGDAPTNLKVTLVYRDPMPPTSASKQLINNLDLQVESPSGEVYWGNVGLDIGSCSSPGGEPSNIDNVENVFVCNAEPGTWTISVWGAEIVEDTYPENAVLDAIYSLVATKGRNYP